jgi:hypothetical protein
MSDSSAKKDLESRSAARGREGGGEISNLE